MDSERKEFERWAAKRVGLSQDGRVNYAYGATRDAWEVWQARAELGEGTPHCTEKLNNLHVNHIALQAECEALRTALADLGVTPEEAKAGAERSRANKQDAERWKMCVQISEDAMRHPDQRENPELYGSYMKANSMGLNLPACIDAAMAAMGKEKA